jgi:hypothetical protein
MGCYLDDDRLAAHAVPHFLNIDVCPIDIYRDILASKYHKWIDQLEQIADDTLWSVLKEWCLDKQSELDVWEHNIWNCGDMALIEKAGWKLGSTDEDEE